MKSNLPTPLAPSRARCFRCLLATISGTLLSAAPAGAADFALRVEGPAEATPTHIAVGATVTLRTAAPLPPASAYQWFFDDAAIPGATAPNLVLSTVTSAQTGNYRLRVVASSASQPQWSETATLNVVAPPAPRRIDLAFTAQLPASFASTAQISTITPGAADGSVIVHFADWAVPAAPKYLLLRLRRDGSADSSFHPSELTVNDRVLAVTPDGQVITALPPYRRAADGSEHPLTPPASVLSVYYRDNPLITALVQPDGKLVVAGYGGIGRINPDDTIDDSFAPEPGVGVGTLWALQLDAQGRLWRLDRMIGYEHYEGSFYPFLVSRYTAAYSRDPSFNHGAPLEVSSVYRTLADGSLSANPTIQLLADGSLLVTSLFGSAGARVFRVEEAGSVGPGLGLVASSSDKFFATPKSHGILARFGGPAGESSSLQRYTLDRTGVKPDAAFSAAPDDAATTGFFPLPNGQALVSGSFVTWGGHSSPHLARIWIDDVPPTPEVALVAEYTLPRAGESFTLSSSIAGDESSTCQWLALDGQPLPAETAASPSLVIPHLSAANLGRYQLRVTGPGGTVLSNVIEIPTLPPYLANLSGRATTGSGENTMIAGLSTKTADSSDDLATLLRGAGPALAPLGLPRFLADPALEVFSRTGELIARNDQWTNPAVASAAQAAGAFAFEPGSNDAALLHAFPSGNASLMLKPQTGGDDIGLLEIYQTSPASAGKTLTNLSFRAHTAPGDATAIAGFVIVDPQNFHRSARVLLRAVGPTLATQGIVHPLADPVLTVYNVQGQAVAQNDNWPSHLTAEYTAFDAATDQVGAFHLLPDSKDAALLLDLPAGAYTLHATGGSGVVLLEIYLVR